MTLFLLLFFMLCGFHSGVCENQYDGVFVLASSFSGFFFWFGGGGGCLATSGNRMDSLVIYSFFPDFLSGLSHDLGMMYHLLLQTTIRHSMWLPLSYCIKKVRRDGKAMNA